MAAIPCLNFVNLGNKNGQEVHIGDSVFTSTWKDQGHCHDFYEFFIVRNGRIIHRLNGTDYTQTAGDICFILPDDVHSFGVPRNAGKALITNVAFSSDLLMNVYQFMTEGRLVDFPKMRYWFKPSLSLLTEIDRKIELLRDTMANSQQKRKTILRTLVVDIITELSFSHSDQDAAIPQWLVHATEEMKKKENYVVGMPRFVGLSGKSQEHLIRSLKLHYRMTPSAFVNGLRLKAAAKTLVTSKDSVLSILLESGFNNVSNFNSSFKKYFGQTPRQYRASVRRFLVVG
jgi:AraC family transcriptional regulator, dual regulator of chb operon